ncbi:hypothetical protein C8Q77DRAFT_1037080, partial [Trametes polyzona]
QKYAMPAPRHYAQRALPDSAKNQPGTSGAQTAVPYRPSPISTPAMSETTTDTSAESHNTDVRFDEQSLRRTLGLSSQDIQSGDVTSWEAPSSSAWLTQRYAQEAQNRHLYGTPTPPGSTQQPSLNPQAGEFVPLGTRVPEAPDSPGAQAAAAQAGLGVLRIQHPWMARFRSGTVTADPQVRAQYARDIVRLGPWDARAMRDLAEKFGERVMEYNEEGGVPVSGVALFAKAIESAFVELHQTAYAQAFREELMRSVWGVIQGFWDASKPASLLCSLHKFPPTTLKPALEIVLFAGELYSVHVAPADFVYRCLGLLTGDMCVIEQLRAVRGLLIRLDYRLQKENRRAMSEILSAIHKNAPRIVPGQSALGEEFDVRVVRTQVE